MLMTNISLKTYNKAVDESLLKYQKKVNNVMLALTVITLMFMPFTVVGGLFGMNVRVLLVSIVRLSVI